MKINKILLALISTVILCTSSIAADHTSVAKRPLALGIFHYKLFMAINHNDLAYLNDLADLVDRGLIPAAHLDITNENGESALSRATRLGKFEAAKILIDCGANPQDALKYAILAARPDILASLCATRRIDLEVASCPMDECLPAGLACGEAKAATIITRYLLPLELLIDNFVFNKPDHEEILRILAKHCSKEQLSRFFAMATIKLEAEQIQILAEAGADINRPCGTADIDPYEHRGHSPLMIAVGKNKVHSTRFLCSQPGLDLLQRDLEGIDVMTQAMGYDHNKEIISLLIGAYDEKHREAVMTLFKSNQKLAESLVKIILDYLIQARR